MAYKRKQGDSLWIDITCDNVTTIDPTWANWSGSWTIAATVGGDALLSGAIGKSSTTGLFQLRIGPSSTSGWSALPVGNYFLTMQIDNTTADYRHEEQVKLVIQTQGKTP